jgi:3-phenylpropionate/trans-cinnamate dioxygenase ferredoxin reductase subunit
MSAHKRVLVVDDEDKILFVVRHALSRLSKNYQVETARNGQQAIQMARATPFDLVVTDVRMPDGDGIALTEALRELDPDPQVIWMTAYHCGAHQAEMKRLGVCCCLEKPIEIGEIRRVVGEALRIKEGNEMQTYKYVIIGGGLAGGRACQGIRRLDKEGSVALITSEAHVPYERPALSKGYLTGKEDLDHVYVKEAAYYEQNQIDVLSGVAATSIDRAAHKVTLGDGRELGYEKLLLATGGRAWRLPIPGADLAGVYTLRTIENSDAIRDAVGTGTRALVLGGSFVGSEVAASLAQLGAQVTMVFPESRLLERVATEELSAHLGALYAGHGVRILSGTKPERLEGADRVERAVLDNGETLEVDLVVMGVGIRLNTALAEAAGLEMWDNAAGRGDAVWVDERLRTSDPDIYAAGDIAAWPDPTFGKRLRVEHWDVAFRQGLRAGRNMAGEDKAYKTLPYFFSDLFDLSFEVWGDLTAWDQTVLRGSLPTPADAGAGSYAVYYFDQGTLTGVLAAGRPKAERKPMPALVKARLGYTDVATKLADEATDLSELAG